MRITQHGNFLTQFTFGQPILPMNCYWVKDSGDSDEGTLIDTALRITSRGLLLALRRMGAKPKRLILTHAHGDHAEALDVLHAAFPSAEVIISEREARLLAGDRTPLAGEPTSRPGGMFPKVKTEPTRLVRPGDKIESLRIVDAAGHTPGQIALLDERDGTLLAGDAFYNVGQLSVVSTFSWRFPLPYWANWNREVANASARRLADLHPQRLALGHGDVVEKPKALLDLALAKLSE